MFYFAVTFYNTKYWDYRKIVLFLTSKTFRKKILHFFCYIEIENKLKTTNIIAKYV